MIFFLLCNGKNDRNFLKQIWMICCQSVGQSVYILYSCKGFLNGFSTWLLGNFVAFFFFFSFLWNSWSVHGNNLVSWNKPEYYDITAAMHKGLRVKDVEECDEIRKCNCTVEIYRDYCVPWVTHCRVPCQCLSSVLFSEVILSLCSLCFHSFLPLLSFSMYLTDQTLGLSQFELCNVFFCLCRH